MMSDQAFTRRFETLSAEDTGSVGGKNASLGEMIGKLKEEGIRVPGGFATTAHAYRAFIEHNDMQGDLRSLLKALEAGDIALDKAGREIRSLFSRAEFPEDVAAAVNDAYEKLCEQYDEQTVDVAVRSSATAEDLPDASFAGQQETFLNVSGSHELLEACKKCYASLFTDRAISYREEKGFDHMKVALSVGVQKMVRSDRAGSGVMFSIDTETGFPDLVVIDAAWGLGENVVQGTVTPDEYRVFKPLLSDTANVPIIEKSLGSKEKKMVYTRGGSRTTRNKDTSKAERRAFVLDDGEIVQLARWAVVIERHYNTPMDMEWAKDGDSGELYIVQARPETVQSRKQAGTLQRYALKEKGEELVVGLSIGQAIAAGKACLIMEAEDIGRFEEGSVLITEMTDPDWVPIMKKAVGIVTNAGGRTCHAAIVSRELGIPAVVGTGDATDVIENEQEVTLSCAEGDEGYVYDGILDYEQQEIDLEHLPDTRTRIMMNVASPAAALRWWRLPCSGIGLARMEFIINNIIQIHPMALVHYDTLSNKQARKQIDELTRGYENKSDYFVDHLALGIARIAAPHYPNEVVVRMSDFKTNEYADLIGGQDFEPQESNPMLGFRGASRYYNDRYRDGFALECRAVRKVREHIGLDNIVIMIPFCRTVEELRRVLEVMAENGLVRGENGLQVYVMAEIPANIILADQFAEHVDGFSIGSNDLTQLVLGVDRDAADLAHLFDEQNEAVRLQIRDLIRMAHEAERKVGICGQAPSDHPEFAAFLVREGIDSISLNPDSVVDVIYQVAEAEADKQS
ncbi:phosphoenolpyruvate synthase [Desulfatitalea alkaliphila]|uniref:Phosphoenolpyruvate synthase n=1 Tax=Desulfatitalea alkaliphila TaxID=2929485 RepID=A0AA41R466_9BACT|nr:phosphoenolpyruvate synthase [Desulfatitalea alkaliphila]MCJ8499028.1 phosphoenolpyruvate synthase [Desulfatitalea alkaliphila]